MAWGSEKDIEKVMIDGMREGSKRFHADKKGWTAKEIGPVQRIPDGVVPNRMTPRMVPTDQPGYEKDEGTGVVINKNMGGYKEFKAKRERGKEVLQLKSDI